MKLFTIKKNEKFIILPLVIILLTFGAGFILNFSEEQILHTESTEIKSSQGLIFDGLISNYTFSAFGDTYNTKFTWTHDFNSWFNVTWIVPGDPISTWVENRDTRIMDNDSGPWAFSTLAHTPMWIFTNVSMSDVVLLCIDDNGDFPYMITNEFSYNLLGFGTIEVWQLDDLITPGGYAWYEKSTGFLIKGVFPFIGQNYTLELTHTSVNFNYVTPISPLFNGLYMHYNASFNGLPHVPSNFTYQKYPYLLDDYNVTWVSFFGPTGTWSVEASTRIMKYFTGGPNFTPGVHEPSWIHTNVNLYDIVPIAIDADGDYMFNITGELVYDLAEYGSIALWILEDIFNPNCTAWYEKSTGILIKGTFIWPGGNYTLDLLKTNALFQYITTPGIPGYHLFIFITLFSVLSLIIIIQKRITKIKQ